MRFLTAVGLIAAVFSSGCGGGMSQPASPTASTPLTATWVGSASDSSGSMMGAGISAGMMGDVTWTITQTGNAFSGTMNFPGHGGGAMMVSGTLNGKSGTFTMTMPSGSMMMAGGCSAIASGSFDMDDMMTQMHGTYAGMNSCGGPFDNGHMSMTRR